jgi:integrase
LSDITKKDIVAFLDRIPASSFALKRSAFAILNRMMNWAVGRGDISVNPMVGMKRPPAVMSRDRVLDDEELAVIWKATGGLRSPLRAFYRVLMLTGQRREEVAGMRWDELDRPNAIWALPGNRTKNGVAHIVPLAPAVLEELDLLSQGWQAKAELSKSEKAFWPKSGPVMSFHGNVSFSSFSQAKRLLDVEIEKARKGEPNLLKWRVHDLRRTMATGFQRLGVRFEVTEAALNHLSGSKSGVAGIYQRYDWRDEKREAFDKWALHIAALM